MAVEMHEHEESERAHILEHHHPATAELEARILALEIRLAAVEQHTHDHAGEEFEIEEAV